MRIDVRMVREGRGCGRPVAAAPRRPWSALPARARASDRGAGAWQGRPGAYAAAETRAPRAALRTPQSKRHVFGRRQAIDHADEVAHEREVASRLRVHSASVVDVGGRSDGADRRRAAAAALRGARRRPASAPTRERPDRRSERVGIARFEQPRRANARVVVGATSRPRRSAIEPRDRRLAARRSSLARVSRPRDRRSPQQVNVAAAATRPAADVGQRRATTCAELGTTPRRDDRSAWRAQHPSCAADVAMAVAPHRADGAPVRRAVSARKRATSTLPPERMTPTRRPAASTRPASRAARAEAPLGSRTSLSRSKAKRMASTISASDTVSTAATRSRTTGKVRSPGMSSCWPSAIVRPTGTRTRSPAASERRVSSPTSGSTPTTAHAGHSAVAAVEQPAISPPPPTGTSSTSSSPPSSISSSAAVPWPAMIRSSS